MRAELGAQDRVGQATADVAARIRRDLPIYFSGNASPLNVSLKTWPIEATGIAGGHKSIEWGTDSWMA
jgi:hypothetical protein